MEQQEDLCEDKEQVEELYYHELSTGLKWFVVLGWITIIINTIIPAVILLLALIYMIGMG